MAKRVAGAKLDTPTARKAIKEGAKAQEPLAEGDAGHYLTYRRGAKGAGTWGALWVKMPDKSERKRTALGRANDAAPADGAAILDYRQAIAKAREWCKGLAQAAKNGVPTRKGPFTVADALEEYFKDGERKGKKGVGRDRMRTRAWILSPIPRIGEGIEAPALGGIEVSKLGRARIEQWQDDMANSPKRLRTRIGRAQNYAEAPATDDEKRARKDSANRVLTILKAALTFAHRRRLTSADKTAWQDVEPYGRTTKARIRFLDQTEAARLVNVSEGPFRDLLRGALLTGARYGELARLQCKDYIPGDNPRVFIAESKSGRPRHITLTPEGAALFDALTIGKAADDLIFSHTGRRKAKSARAQGAWAESDQRRPLLIACKAAGIEPPISFHELRHTYASMLVNAGCPLVYVAEQLGHSDTRMTERHYGHIRPDAKAAAIRAAMPDLGITEPSKIQKLKLS